MKPYWIGIVSLLGISLFQDQHILNIEITNIRNSRGVIRLSVYTAENQYPYHPYRTFVVAKDSLREGKLMARIADLPPGQYGLCLLDDENNSGEMENNLLGIPLEGFGFANNPRPLIKRPDYDRVQFRMHPGNNQMNLIVRYK